MTVEHKVLASLPSVTDSVAVAKSVAATAFNLNSNSNSTPIPRAAPIHLNATEAPLHLWNLANETTNTNTNSTMNTTNENATTLPQNSNSNANVTRKITRPPSPFPTIVQAPEAKAESNAPILSQQIDEYFENLSGNYNSSDTQWIQEYLHWHAEARQAFPDQKLLDDLEAPRLLIAYLDPAKQGGGLTDRMKGLGHLVRLAFENQQVLLLKWYDAPVPLEAFLEPHLLNFTLPAHPNTTTPEKLKEAYGTDAANQKVTLTKFNNQLGNYLHPYGVLWHALFEPAAPIRKAIDSSRATLGLQPGLYDAVHCRIGHPAYFDKKSYDSKADKVQGYNFKGTHRVRAMTTAIRGIQCSQWLAQQQQQQQQLSPPSHLLLAKGNTTNTNGSVPIYFYADSADLVRTVLVPTSLDAKGADQEALVEQLTLLRNESRIVGRLDAEVAHLQSRQNNTSYEAYASTFVDLYLASQARCVSMGVGRFAYMAAKISGTSCWTRHQVPSRAVGARWGMTLMSREVPKCRLPADPPK